MPTVAQALEIAVQHHSAGRLPEAEAIYRQILAREPRHADCLHLLGVIASQVGQFAQAGELIAQSLALQPHNATALSNLGVALNEQGRHAESAAACRRATQLQPAMAEPHYNLANALRDLGEREGAIAEYHDAIRLRPAYALAHMNLSNLLEKGGQSGAALAACRSGIAECPKFAPLHNNLGHLLKERGDIDAALASIRRAVELAPDSQAIHSNYLAVLQYASDVTLPVLFHAHREFAKTFAPASPSGTTAFFPNAREPERPLRLGFVSPHFGFHPVGHFLIRLLENLDRTQFVIVGYSDAKDEDAMTDRLRNAMTEWRRTATWNDAALTARIREDRIDILFDLAGHTSGNRLAVFARKAAPIQITWLDYVGTTGLPAMDYIIGDPHEIPTEAEPWYQEKVLRLPDDYICYQPPEYAPVVGPLPALTNGCVTFCSFNIPAKTNAEIVRVWARILAAVAGSRMVLKNRSFDDPETRSRYASIFTEHGIAPERVEMLGWSPNSELLAGYGEADIALDTFPYNGGLTTCEAIWMGVPVVTRCGETFASRHGLSHLTAAGLGETIAQNADEYIRIATELAADLPRLASLRAGMRARIASSPLCDGRRFATHFMELLRAVWRQWKSANIS